MFLVTGAAGFIGYHTCEALLSAGEEVLGLDNLNRYYPVSLKQARLERLHRHSGFDFALTDVANHEALLKAMKSRPVDVVIHLAAQAGVRHSIDKPFDYAAANLTGHLSVLEACRHSAREPLLVYASSSSVYGGNTKVPFAETDPVDAPVSLYAATKRADELMSAAYASLYGLRQIGLRFFTVYGPWGRPDMAYWSFTEKILNEEPIHVFNNGELKRDFTYIDDIVEGVVATATKPASFDPDRPHKIYNIGNHEPVGLMRFIELLEERIGKKAEKIMEPMQPGDVFETYADIDAIRADYGFEPHTSLEVGLTRFVDWFKAYKGEEAG